MKACWDLKSLNRRYARFVAKWEPSYKKLAQGECLSPDECFVQRFWITNEHSEFPRLDPNLPDALLPADWQGDKPACIFNEYRNLLSERANEFLTPCSTGRMVGTVERLAMGKLIAEQMEYQEICYEQADWVARVTLNRPQAYNAYSTKSISQLIPTPPSSPSRPRGRRRAPSTPRG